MRTVGSAYEESLAPHVSANQATLPIYSTVTGHLAAAETSFGPSYWRSNLESPVLFSSAVQSLLRDFNNDTVVVEIGPHCALKGPLRQVFASLSSTSSRPTYVPTLVRGSSATVSALATLGHLFCLGQPVNLSLINPASRTLVDLPLYPWDHSVDMWYENRISKAWRSRQHPHHELLGSSCAEASGLHQTWRNLLSLKDVPWLRDHMVVNDVVLPCAAYITMMGEAIRQSTGSISYRLRDLVVKSALIIPQSEKTEIMTTLNQLRLTDYTKSSWYELSVASFNGTSWVSHCTAQGKAAQPDVAQLSEERFNNITSPLPRQIRSKHLYKRMKEMGLNFGPHFHTLEDISTHPKECIARATIVDGGTTSEAKRKAVHAATIDACLQLSAVAGSKGIARNMASLRVPRRIGNIYVCPGDSEAVAEATLQAGNVANAGQVDAIAVARDQKVIVSLEDAKFIRLDTGNRQGSPQNGSEAVARLVWSPHVDFFDAGDLLHGVRMRDTLIILERHTALSMLESLDLIQQLNLATPPGYLIKYVRWLEKEKQRMLQGEYSLVPQASLWAAMSADSRTPILEALRAEIVSLESSMLTPILSLCTTTLNPDNWKGILQGKIHPLQTFLSSGGLPAVYNLANSSLDAAAFVQVCGHSQPNLRILEVGGGTAGTTEVVLSHLASAMGTRRYSTYVFTDISAGFFASARERLGQWEGVEYKTLDITKDPVQQGFKLGDFDIVIAANVSTRAIRGGLGQESLLLRVWCWHVD